VVRVVVPVHAQQCFDADVSGDVNAAQQTVIGEAGKGKIAGSVVTERPLLADTVEKVFCG
jgi:hypothetical protein